MPPLSVVATCQQEVRLLESPVKLSLEGGTPRQRSSIKQHETVQHNLIQYAANISIKLKKRFKYMGSCKPLLCVALPEAPTLLQRSRLGSCALGTLALSRDIFVGTTEGWGRVLLASSGQRPGVLLHLAQCTGGPPPRAG